MFGHNEKDDDTNDGPIADSTLDDNGSPSVVLPGSDDSVVTSSDYNDVPQTLPPTTPQPEEDEELLPAHASGSGWDDTGGTKDDSAVPDNSSDDLLGIKQKALGQLSPLVSHLDQNPEERFKTIMMMIQAADNQALIPEAYEAAQSITDEAAKAQALLDVVNEINYFTQQSKS